MGRLTAISKAAREIDQSASKGRAVERDWALAAKRKSQMSGLDEYFARNDPKAEPTRGRPGAPKPPDEKPGVLETDNNGYEATHSLAELKRMLKLAEGGPVRRYGKGGAIAKKVGTGLLKHVAQDYATAGLTGGITGGVGGTGILSGIGTGMSGVGGLSGAVGSGLSSLYGGLAAMGPVGWAGAAALAAGAVAAKNAKKSSPLNHFDSDTGMWSKGENFANQQFTPEQLNAYYGPAVKAFKDSGGDTRAALAALPAPTNAAEQAMFDGRQHLFNGTGNPLRQEAKDMGLKNGEWKAGGQGKKDLLKELKTSAAAPIPGQAALPNVKVPDLAAQQQQANATNAAAPGQLAMLQNRAQTARVQPNIPGSGGPSLLQRIQSQQAARPSALPLR